MNIRTIVVGRQELRIATSEGRPGSTPLLAFNGLGANLELMHDFASELSRYGIGIIVFDVPGIGGSSAPSEPYRFPWIAQLANELLVRLEVAGQVDVAGVSWGGAAAQEFAHRYPGRVRRLVLAATTPGAVAVPARWSTLSKMLSIRRYADRNYMARVGAQLYGGKLRASPQLLERYSRLFRPPSGIGYALQLRAAVGWTSVHWLYTLLQPTLVMMGTDDPIVPLANGHLLASLIPRARLVTLDDGHLFLVTSARECARIVHDFLTEPKWPRKWPRDRFDDMIASGESP
jgi:poly(3-hydroxyalkanoate) depolymerase